MQLSKTGTIFFFFHFQFLNQIVPYLFPLINNFPHYHEFHTTDFIYSFTFSIDMSLLQVSPYFNYCIDTWFVNPDLFLALCAILLTNVSLVNDNQLF